MTTAVWEWVPVRVTFLRVGDLVKDGSVGTPMRVAYVYADPGGSIEIRFEEPVLWSRSSSDVVYRWEPADLHRLDTLWCFVHGRQAVAEMTDDPFECGSFLQDCDVSRAVVHRVVS